MEFTKINEFRVEHERLMDVMQPGGICALETLWFGLGLRDHLLTTLLLLLQGSIFWRTGVDNEESFWDVVEDAKFEVKEPEAKKSKKEEEEEEEE